MIIIEGPDHTGKTKLAKKLSEQFSMPYYHFAKESTYMDYLTPLCKLKLRNAVVDRWAFSEHPYSLTMNRKFAFTLKEWHNLILLTLAHNPLVVLCTHKPLSDEYSSDQYLPYDKWDECLDLYKHFLHNNQIRYIEYDYAGVITPKTMNIMEFGYNRDSTWWEPMWRNGYGFIGSHYPKYLLVAERIGPNNMNNLPFETGPTGHMLSDMLQRAGTPLGSFAVTNMVKSYRRDTRAPNKNDEELLYRELTYLRPKIAVFMGKIAQLSGMKIVRGLGIEAIGMTHFGYYSHRGITDISALCGQWAKITNEKEIKDEKTRDRPALPFTTTNL